MAAQLTLRRAIEEAYRWLPRLRMFVTQTTAILLLASLSLASARTQDAAEPDSDQRSAARPNDLSRATAKAAEKLKVLEKLDAKTAALKPNKA